MPDSYLFTSEAVAAGHPDKMADQISDAVLDSLIQTHLLRGEPVSDLRCACETMVKTGVVIVAGEVRSRVFVDIEDIVRRTVCQIGYDKTRYGFDGNSCAVINMVSSQSSDIAIGVDKKAKKKMGAGDQGLMFGYACNETPARMPLPIQLAHQLMIKHAQLRRRQLDWLGPDAKAQVSIRYQNDVPVGVEAVVFSTQHDESIAGKKVTKHDARIRRDIIEHIIKPVLKQHKHKMPAAGNIHINPTGRFVEGGPKGDCGLTGRKIIVDTYGGTIAHGGGAFSGKDPTKVDRSAAYMMRYLAKNVVAAGLADKCLIQVAYAIGVAEPVSLMVDTRNTAKKITEKQIQSLLRQNFDLTPEGISRHLDLWQPIYQKTAHGGHFGRNDSTFTWEKTDAVERLLSLSRARKK